MISNSRVFPQARQELCGKNEKLRRPTETRARFYTTRVMTKMASKRQERNALMRTAQNEKSRTVYRMKFSTRAGWSSITTHVKNVQRKCLIVCSVSGAQTFVVLATTSKPSSASNWAAEPASEPSSTTTTTCTSCTIRERREKRAINQMFLINAHLLL